MTDFAVQRGLAEAIREAALSVPGVRAVRSTGPIATATLYPGGRVDGVRVIGDRVLVHIVVDRAPVTAVAEQVRTVARIVLVSADDERPVDIVVGDVARPADPSGG